MIKSNLPHAALFFPPKELEILEEVCRYERRAARYASQSIKLSSDIWDELVHFNSLVRSFINVATIKITKPDEWMFALLSSDASIQSYKDMTLSILCGQRRRVLAIAHRTLSRYHDEFEHLEYLAESLTYNSLICKQKIELIEQALTAGLDPYRYANT